MKQLIFFLYLCALTSGCALTKANLDVSYDLDKAEKGPLSSVQPLRVNINEFADSRVNKEQIGHKINGLGMETADILTEEPVPEIIHSAITALFEKNGHLLKKSNEQLVIDGEIKEFWLELQMNMMSIEFMGTMIVTLNVKDANQNIIYAREYQGHYDEKKAAGYVKSWEKVMNITLEKLIYQIATDQELVQVLNAQARQAE